MGLRRDGQRARGAIFWVNAGVFVCFLQHIMSEPEEITTMSGQKLPLKMSADYISSPAHADYQQTSELISNHYTW